MSYTTNRQPQGMSKGIEGFLREGLIAEAVAINDYSHFIASTENKELKEMFHEIMLDEKRHYSLFLEALRFVDEEQRSLAGKAKESVKISSKEKYKDYTFKYNKDVNILESIREAIKGEHEAILLYEEFVSNLESGSIVGVIKEIIRDEKEHTEELTRALIILDKDNYGTL